MQGGNGQPWRRSERNENGQSLILAELLKGDLDVTALEGEADSGRGLETGKDTGKMKGRPHSEAAKEGRLQGLQFLAWHYTALCSQ